MEDQVDFFNQLLSASEQSKINEDMLNDESVVIISDYVDSHNIHRAVDELQLCTNPDKRYGHRNTTTMQNFVDVALCMFLKNGNASKLSVPSALGQLFAQLITQQLLTYKTLFSRFQKFFKRRFSFEVKYKHFMETVTEFLTSLLISLSQYYKKYVLCGMLSAFKRSGEAQEIMASVMKRLSELHSPESAAKLWESAKFQWSDFLQPGTSERMFIRINELDFLNPDAFSDTSDNELEVKSVRPKDYVKPELNAQQTKSFRANNLCLTPNFVNEHSIGNDCKGLLTAYFEDGDMEKFRLKMQHFLKRRKAVEFFARYAIQTGVESGLKFCAHVGKLLSYLIAFGHLTEVDRVEGMKVVAQTLLGKREAAFKDKDAIKKVISSFMSDVKSTALWASQKMELSRILDEDSLNCLDQVLLDVGHNDEAKAKSSPTFVHFPTSQKLGDTITTRRPKSFLSVKLHTSDVPWKARLHLKRADDAGENLSDEELMKQFRGILNKLTPQKYSNLLEDVKKLTIDTDSKLQMIIELIFDKAVDEPEFSNHYAILCKQLATLKVMNVKENKDVKFYPLLLARCQKEFESKMYEGIDVEGKQKKIDEATNPETKKLLFDELDVEKRRARRRSLGNIKFIGELFNEDMIKNNVILGCIDKLLSEEEEESLECLCTLLRTIGAKLEGSPRYQELVSNLGRDSLAPYFTKLLTIVNEKKTSARVRFMIQDILDLQQNKWRTRKIQDENKPKTSNKCFRSLGANYAATKNVKHVFKKFGVQSSTGTSLMHTGTEVTDKWRTQKAKQSNVLNEASLLYQGKFAGLSNSVEARNTADSTSLVPILSSPMVAKIDGKTKDYVKDLKGDGILTDYLTDNNIHEAVKDYHLYYDQSNSAQFVSTAVNHAIHDKVSMNALGKLLVHFVAHNIIKPEQFTNGWLNTLSCAKDSHQGGFEFVDLIASMLDDLHNCNCPGSHMPMSENKKVFAYILQVSRPC